LLRVIQNRRKDALSINLIIKRFHCSSGLLSKASDNKFARVSRSLSNKARSRSSSARSSSPALRSRLIHIPTARLFILHAQQDAVMRPAQFVTQCVTNWKSRIKEAHVAQV
jgi:hypothetical protein